MHTYNKTTRWYWAVFWFSSFISIYVYTLFTVNLYTDISLIRHNKYTLNRPIVRTYQHTSMNGVACTRFSLKLSWMAHTHKPHRNNPNRNVSKGFLSGFNRSFHVTAHTQDHFNVEFKWSLHQSQLNWIKLCHFLKILDVEHSIAFLFVRIFAFAFNLYLKCNAICSLWSRLIGGVGRGEKPCNQLIT